MSNQDKNYAEKICGVFRILPVEKREYLMGVADGLAAMQPLSGGQERNAPAAQAAGDGRG